MNQQKNTYEYYAFVSYKREDEKWAKWLQKKLESYTFPAVLRKKSTLPYKIRPVFRDQSELSGGNLKIEIEKGLNDSKFLVVICSPRSSKSPWVSKEVQYFIDQQREKFIIPFIIGGVPNAANVEEECFPESLRSLKGEKELLGININEMGRDAAIIKVISCMFGIRFNSLWQRHEKERRRKRFLVVALLLVLAVISLFIAVVISNQNLKLKEANAAINSERRKVQNANNALIEANEQVKHKSLLLTLSNDSLLLTNNMLIQTNKALGIERDNVVIKTYKLQKEQLRLIAKQGKSLFEQGNVWKSYQLIRPMVDSIINHMYPYSSEIASLLNKIKWYLNRDGYKVIERLMSSDDSLVYVSPNLRYIPIQKEVDFI